MTSYFLLKLYFNVLSNTMIDRLSTYEPLHAVVSITCMSNDYMLSQEK